MESKTNNFIHCATCNIVPMPRLCCALLSAYDSMNRISYDGALIHPNQYVLFYVEASTRITCRTNGSNV